MNKKSFYLILISIICVFFFACTSNVNTFKPQNDDEAMIKQIFVDFQEGTLKKDLTLFEHHIDDNVVWTGKHHFTNKDQFIANAKKDHKAIKYRHENVLLANLRINLKSEDKAQALVNYTDKDIKYVRGHPVLFKFLLKKLYNGNERWVIYKKMTIPKHLEKYYQ